MSIVTKQGQKKILLWKTNVKSVIDIFANIVKRCVLGGNAIGVALGADEEKPEVGAAMQQVFYNEVVSQLRSLKV